jgi:hypothetical protein
MRTVIVYESMYGNTHAIAVAIAAGIHDRGEVVVVPVALASPEVLDGVGLLVVGGPTHAHSLTSNTSRKSAADAAAKPDSELTMDADAFGPGLRDWFSALATAPGTTAAAFDTRYDGPPMLTGHASKGIGSRLRKHGYELITEPESFIVDKANHLLDGEVARAEAWGAALADHFAPAS